MPRPVPFKLTSPLMKSRNVAFFQRTLNRQLRAWKVRKRLDVDGEYGTDTRDTAKTVAFGLGLSVREIERHGVTPETRRKIRDPERRTPAERARGERRGGWIKRLRRRFARGTRGPQAAIAYARKHRGLTERPPGTNRGPLIDRWMRLVDCPPGQPWCGGFVNACLMAAGFPTQPWLRYCPWIEGRAKSREGGWSWHSIRNARAGDLVLYGRGIAQHVALYVGGGVTIEGNTSGGPRGSQNNGGGVYQRRRNFGAAGFPARGVARPPYRR